MRLRLKSVSLAVATASLAWALCAPGALAEGPFAGFGGAWRGTGRVSDVHGKSESLTCRSSNSPASDGIAMTLTLVCASDSYKVDFRAELYTDGQALRGTWTEQTRDATGNISGTIRPELISARTTAPGFSATILIRVTGGRRLDVSLNAKGTNVNRVDVSMKR